MASVLIIVESKDNLGLTRDTKEIFDRIGVDYEVKIASSHRDPNRLQKIVKDSDALVFIGASGLAAHLPGAVASFNRKTCYWCSYKYCLVRYRRPFFNRSDAKRCTSGLCRYK